MPKTVMINARIEPRLKRRVGIIFKKLGLTTTQAVTIFFAQVENVGGIPFEVRLPNSTTRKAIQSARSRTDMKKFDTVEELEKELES